MKVTLEDALSLRGKYVEERTPVLPVFVTPSVSVARVTGTIQISVVDGLTPLLVGGEEDRASDEIELRLPDCNFEYCDFRDATAEEFRAYLDYLMSNTTPCNNDEAKSQVLVKSA